MRSFLTVLYLTCLQVLALDSSYRDASELLEATEASHYGLDNHSSNGIYLEVGEVIGDIAEDNTTGTDSNNSSGQSAEDNGNLVGIGMTTMNVPETPVRESVYQRQHSAGPVGAAHPFQLQNLAQSPDEIYQQEHTPLLGANNYNATYNATHSATSHAPATPHTHPVAHTPHTAGTPHSHYTLQHRRVGESSTVRKYYAPTVIPIVQSKTSMVIVGAVLRKDLQESLSKLNKFAEVASAAPVKHILCS